MSLYHRVKKTLNVLAANRQIIAEMAKRDVLDRYSGQSFAVLWPLIHPIFMMGVYVFIFAVVFKLKIGGTRELPLDYTAYLLSGLIAWLACQEVLVKSCTMLTSNATLVKQVIFPIEILPFKGVVASLLPLLVSLVALSSYVTIKYGAPPVTYLFIPVLLIFQTVLMTGISLILAILGAYFRDIKDFVQLFSLAGVYLMPVFYLPEWVPTIFKPLLYINPFSYVVWCYQDLLYFGRIEHLHAWIGFGVFSLVFFVLGVWIFERLRAQLGNVV